MEFEIAIEGPLFAISALSRKLRDLPWVHEMIPITGADKRRAGKISILETESAPLDEKVLHISRIIRGIKRSFSPEPRIDIRVRNLSYSEPSTVDTQVERPFHPIPSIAVQPWSPSLPKLAPSETIVLDSGRAFGTGQHPTTRLCLRITNLMANGTLPTQGLSGKKVLDFGCGSGLLAIAAIRMGGRRAVGVEIDPASAKAAKRNVALNNLSATIEIREGSWHVVEEKYGLVLANIVPGALLRGGNHITDWVKRGGSIIVSGFGESQNDEMKGFFANMGFVISRDFTLDGWGALVMEQKG